MVAVDLPGPRPFGVGLTIEGQEVRPLAEVVGESCHLGEEAVQSHDVAGLSEAPSRQAGFE